MSQTNFSAHLREAEERIRALREWPAVMPEHAAGLLAELKIILEELEAGGTENATLAAIGRIISSSLDIEQVYEPFADQLRGVIPFDRISVAVFDLERSLIDHWYASGVEIPGRGRRETYGLAGTLAEEVLGRRSPVLLQGADVDEQAARFSGLAPVVQRGFHSFLSVPLLSQDQVIGALHLRSLSENAYSERDVELAQRIALQIAGAIASAQLFARLKQSQEALRQAEERYRTLVELSPEAILVHAEGGIIYANPAAVTLMDADSVEEVIGRPIPGCVHQDQGQAISQRSVEVEGDGKVRHSSEVTYVRPTGELRILEVSSAPIVYDGKAARLVFLRDLTDRRQAEQLHDNVNSLVSHELRTPLANIKGYSSSLLQTDVQWDEEVKLDFIRSIDRAADRMSRLIEGILEMTRLQSGRLPLHRRAVSPGTLVQSAVRQASPFLADHDVSICISTELPQVRADPERIEQMLINLLQNAARYSSSGSPVRVEAGTEGMDVVFSVVDSGVGIAPEYHEAVFQMFSRIQHPGHPQAPGTGLGLALSKIIVEAHGGSIWVESAPNKGATFRFTLPVDMADETQIAGQDLD